MMRASTAECLSSQHIGTLRALIRSHALHSPDAPCIVSVSGGLLTWRDLGDQLERTCTTLRNLGVGPHDRAAVVLSNGPALASVFLTVAASTASAPLNPAYSTEEFAFYLNDLAPKVLIVGTETDGPAIEAARRLGIPVLACEPDGSTPGRFELAGTRPGTSAPTGTINHDSVALLLHTSGTTSRPKLVPLRHRNLLASMQNMVRTLRLSRADRCLNIMPLFHIHGLVGGLLAPLAAGGSTVCPPSFRLPDFFLWLDRTRPTWFTAVPTMHRAIVTAAPDHSDIVDRTRLRFIRSSSAPLPAALFDELGRTFRAPVLEAYSMTEAAHQMTCNPLAPGAQRPGTVGIPAGPDVAVMNDEGHLVAAGEVGEIVIRGPSVMSEYEANASANAAAFVNGWFRTGDQGRFDAEGYLVLTGRLKEQINRGGEKVAPLEIDQALLRHPAVAEAAAFGFPHPTLGEEIAAVVVLRPQVTVDAVQLRVFLRDHLAAFKIPRRILILEQIPKGPSGKIQRRLLSTLCDLDATASPALSGAAEKPATDLERELLGLWSALLNRESVGLNDDFFELGGDSLLAVQMLMELENTVGRKIPETVMFECPTVRRLAHAIATAEASTPEPLVVVQPGGEQPPIFFFHGDYAGHGYYTRALARLLGSDRPFIAVAPHGLGPKPVPPSIEEMAAERLPLLLAEQPRGPFRLGGFCNGGWVAFEVARLLMDAGHRVELVFLIQSPTLNLRPTVRKIYSGITAAAGLLGHGEATVSPPLASAIDLIWRRLNRLERISGMALAGLARRTLHNCARWPSRSHGVGAASHDDVLHARPGEARLPEFLRARERALHKIYSRVYRNYFPEPLDLPTVYLSASYRTGPLRRLGSKVEIVHLPGGHWGCITTHGEHLARHLRQRLEQINSVDTQAERDQAEQSAWSTSAHRRFT